MNWDKNKFQDLVHRYMHEKYPSFMKVRSNDLPKGSLLFRRKSADQFEFILFQPHNYDPAFTVECAIASTEDFPIDSWPMGITDSVNQSDLRARIGYLAKQKQDVWFYLIGWPSHIKRDSSEWVELHFKGLLFSEQRYENAVLQAFEMIEQFAIPFFENPNLF